MSITIAIVEHIQEDQVYNRFYAQAAVTLAADVDYAELQLKDAGYSVHAAPIMSAQVGPNTFHTSGSGSSPFKVGDAIQAVCFPKGGMP